MSKADKLRVPLYLGHILEAIRRIHQYVADMDEAQFLADEKTQDTKEIKHGLQRPHHH